MLWGLVNFALSKTCSLCDTLVLCSGFFCLKHKLWQLRQDPTEELMKPFSESAECMKCSELSAEKHEEMSARLKCQHCSSEQKQETSLPAQ